VLFVTIAPFDEPDITMATLVDEARVATRRFARRAGYHFVGIGVALDWVVDDGVRKLSKLGDFDEVIVGGNWMNTGIRLFVGTRGPELTIPQIVVFLQERTVSREGVEAGPLRELRRVVGLPEMMAWKDAGHPIPEPAGL
jgi:hypothetical protein